MKLMLRSKSGGRLEIIDADTGMKLDGVLGIDLHAGLPDFSPTVRVTMRPAVAVDAEAIKQPEPQDVMLTGDGVVTNVERSTPKQGRVIGEYLDIGQDRIAAPQTEQVVGQRPPRPLPTKAKP